MRRRNFIKSAFGLVAYAAMSMQMLRAEKSPVKQLPEADPEPETAGEYQACRHNKQFAALLHQYDKYIRENYFLTPYPVKGSSGDCLGVATR